MKKVLIFLVFTVIVMVSCSEKDNKLTFNIYPQGAGIILKEPNRSYYEDNTDIEITAVANIGYYFTHWSGNITGNENPFVINIDSDKKINANFSEGVIENFNDNEANNFITDLTSRWHSKNEAYQMVGINANNLAFSYYPYKFKDFEVSVDIKVLKSDTIGHAFGIYFRSQNNIASGNSYRLSIMRNGLWNIGKMLDGRYYFLTDNWIYCDNLKRSLDSVNNIKVVIIGNQVDIYFNSVYQRSLKDLDDFSDGFIGLCGYDSNKYQNKFEYDNFKVKTSDINVLKSVNIKNNLCLSNTKRLKFDEMGK